MSTRQPTVRELEANLRKLADQLQRVRVVTNNVRVKDGDAIHQAAVTLGNLYAIQVDAARRELVARRTAQRAGGAA